MSAALDRPVSAGATPSAPAASKDGVSSRRGGCMQERTLDICLGCALLGLGALLWTQLEGLPVEGVLFPAALICLLAAGSLALIARALLCGSGVVDFFGETPARQWCMATALFAAQCIVAMYVSFRLGMGCGMLLMLFLLSPARTGRSLAGNVLFVAAFLGALEIFFCRIMRIYFPENLLF